MDEPWMIYYEELRERGEDIPDQEWNRAEDMAEAAHEAYEATADRLHNQLDWGEEDALVLTRGFGRVVKDWIEEDEMDWAELEARLKAHQGEWDQAKERSPG